MKVLKLLLIFSVFTFAQNKKFQFAQSYLENGDFKDASRLFLELYETDKNNKDYFWGLYQSLKAQSKYLELLPIAESFISKQNNPKLDAALGDIYWKSGNSGAAIKTWNDALNNHNKMIVFQAVADAQISNRQYQDALRTYDLARSKTRDKSLYHNEVIKLLISLGDYKRGIDEIMDNFTSSEDFPIVQGRVFALISSDSSKIYIKKRLTKIANKESDNVFKQELLAWFYKSNKEFDGALELYIRLDKLKRTKGYQIFRFAEDARKDNEYDLAIKAYEKIIDNKRSYQNYYSQSLIGYARTIEAKFLNEGELTETQSKEIIDRYQEIYNRVKKVDQKSDALYRIGRVTLNGFNDYTKAIEIFTKVVFQFPRSKSAANSELELANIYLKRGDFKLARTHYQNCISTYPSSLKGLQDKAKFMLAKTEYYIGEFEKAKKSLATLKNINSDIANDALELFFFIENYKKNEADLKKYANFEYLIETKKDDDIKIEINNIKSSFTNQGLLQKALIEYASYFKSKDTDYIIKFGNQFLFDHAASIFADQMLITLAICYEKKEDFSKAIELYSKLLVDYPNSIYLQQARDNIRKLRGDS